LERGKAEWEFCTLPVRVFQTIKVNVSESENPQAELVKAIGKKEIQDAVVRLIYQLRSEQLDLIDNAELHILLGEAHSYTIQPELVSQLARPRLPELNANNSIEPLEALKTYLASREDLKDVAESMLEAAQGLLGNTEEVLVEF
ncbi:MAG: DNA double-strand break repair protein Mre11, partial [Microcoleus sp.]